MTRFPDDGSFESSDAMRVGGLIVLDETANMLSLVGPLKVAGYRVMFSRVNGDLLRSIEFLKPACIVLTTKTSEGDLEWIQLAHSQHPSLVIVMLVNAGDVRAAVRAIRVGCSEVVEMSSRLELLVRSISRALLGARASGSSSRSEALNRLSSLTPRQVQVLERVLQGQANKLIASDLSISQRTVENHRASIMTKTGSRSLPALTRLAVTADGKIPVVPDRPSIRGRSTYLS